MDAEPTNGTSEWPSGQPFSSEAARRDALSGRVAVVTGASRGLGAGLALHFAAAGLHLGLCARHRPELVAKTRPRAHDGHVDPPEPPVVASVDVTNFGSLAAFADAVVTRFGRIDLWVNNAGIIDPIGPLAEATPAAVAGHVATNVLGVAYGSMLFARHVATRDGGGVLVNVSSGAAVHPYAGLAAYSASKAAVDALTQAVSNEERRHGLRAYAVTPGHVDTDMQVSLRGADESRFPASERFRRMKELEAFSSPDWVAEKVLELAFGDCRPEGVRLRVPPQPQPQPPPPS